MTDEATPPRAPVWRCAECEAVWRTEAQRDRCCTAPPEMIRLDDVLAVLDACSSAPDGYYYARKTEHIMGWEAAARRIRAKIEELADAS